MGTNKLLFAGGLLIALMGIVYYWLFSQPGKDQGYLVPVGFGNPTGTSIEICVAVSMGMPRKEGPRLKNGVLQWDEWVADHFHLADSSGQRVQLRRFNFARYMSDQVAGTPEFFLLATLTPGKVYTLDYTPILAEPEQYRYSFTAPAQAQDGARVAFEPHPG